MPTFSKSDVPFLLGGSGTITVDASPINLAARLPPDAPTLSVGFSAGGGQTLPLGQPHTVKVGVSVSANAQLVPIFPGATGAPRQLLQTNGLGAYFKDPAHAADLVLALDIGAAASASARGVFSYAALTAAVTVDAGADGGYSYLRAFPASQAARLTLKDFFGAMRLPEQLTDAPTPGEAIALRYGGYLRLGAEVASGYQLSGTKSVTAGALQLSEHYGLSVLGRVGLAAGVAGRFAILVTADDDLAGWARVRVRRLSSKDFKVAADVNVTFAHQLDNLPGDASDFLGAILGVNGKSFVTVLQRALALADFEQFSAAIDGLAKRYVGDLIGTGFDALSKKTAFTTFLARVQRVVTSYETLEDRAVTVFERHLDELDVVRDFLTRVTSVGPDSLQALRKHLTPELWGILAQLTDGDPLRFLTGAVVRDGKALDTVAELKRRAQAVLHLLDDPEHEELRRVITVAKGSFGVDALLREAAKIDTVDELRALASDKVGQFVSRLVGRGLESATDLKAALAELKQVRDRMDEFTTRLYDAFRQAANSSYAMALHAEYSRATEREALVDVSINMHDALGRGLFAEAARGEFERVLTSANTDAVRVRDAVLTHRTRRESAFKVNIVGWHLNYAYEGFDRVITESEQRIVPSEHGLTVLSTTTLDVGRRRKRRQEEMQTNLLVRALGQSAGVVPGDDRTLSYVIDAITSLSASYTLGFTDDDTSQAELEDYLAFAREFGLDRQGATLDDLIPVLPRAPNGGFGRVEGTYDVRFSKAGLEALLGVTEWTAAADDAVRRGMRRIVLANYLRDAVLPDVAFAYATPAVHAVFADESAPTFSNRAPRVFDVAPVVAVQAPSRVQLSRTEARFLETLYLIEESMVDALKALVKALASRKTLTPAALEKLLGKFGDALLDFDRFDQTSNARGVGTTTLFAMVDALMRAASGGAAVHDAVLRLKSDVQGRAVEKLFLH